MNIHSVVAFRIAFSDFRLESVDFDEDSIDANGCEMVISKSIWKPRGVEGRYFKNGF